MALPTSSTGLGIDLQARDRLPSQSRQRVRRSLTGPRSPSRQRPKTTVSPMLSLQTKTMAPPPPRSGTLKSSQMRSVGSMQGLEGAQRGQSMVSFDLGGGHAREGSRIGLDSLTPGGCSLPRRYSVGEGSQVRDSPKGLPRDVTLLSFGASHFGGDAADLKSLLGDSNARLKSGAVIPPGRGRNTKDKKAHNEHAVALEQAKSHARVEADIVLESNVCVQGGYVRGHIKIRIGKRSKKQSPVLLAEGKIRVVGYEVITDGDERHIFYQCAAPLSSITDAAHSMYSSASDEDGFAQGVEGVHVLPFALYLPEDGSFGTPKGTVNVGSGTMIRYIAMVSIRVKDSCTGKRSLAHFYRDCEVWPLLNPTVMFQPASRPIQATTNKSMSLIGSSSAKVRLNAQLHRLHWPAGSRCPISVHVVNGSKKTVRGLSLTLVRTTTVFHPQRMLDADGDRDPDSCQTATVHKVIAESCLEMGGGAAKGHASAKGWWTGISPGQELEFTHFIMLPPDAVSVTRARLLEVEYSIRVTLNAGSLASNIFVTLPIRIFNFISIDPPPSAGLLSNSGAYIRSTQIPAVAALERAPSTFSYTAAQKCTRLPTTLEAEEDIEDIKLPATIPQTPYHSELRVTNPDISPQIRPEDTQVKQDLVAVSSEASMYSTETSSSQEGVADGDVDTSPELPYITEHPEQGGNLELEGDVGSDEELEAVLKSANVDQGHFDAMSTGGSRRSGCRSSKVRYPKEEATPRMEGIGSGMRGLWKKEQERKLLAARLQEHARRRLRRPMVRSSSDTAASPEEDMPTPKMRSVACVHSAASETDASFTTETHVAYSLQRGDPRCRLQSVVISQTDGSAVQMRHSHLGIIRKLPNTIPGLSKPVAPPTNRSPRKEAPRQLPRPPTIPSIPARPNAFTLRTTRTLHGQTTLSDSEMLRQVTIRPPASPVRPPRSPLRARGGSSACTSISGEETSGIMLQVHSGGNSLR